MSDATSGGPSVESPPKSGDKSVRGNSRHSARYRARSVSCQVAGCEQEVPQKAYFKRYAICAHHVSLPSMVLEGVHVRWCQQCGRFQSIGEFDGEKRSCRSKLSKHNQRRRGKPAPAATDSAAKEPRGSAKRQQKQGAAPALEPLACSSPQASGDSAAGATSGTGSQLSGRAVAAERHPPPSQLLQSPVQSSVAAPLPAQVHVSSSAGSGAAAAAASQLWQQHAQGEQREGSVLTLSQLLFEQLLLGQQGLPPVEPSCEPAPAPLQGSSAPESSPVGAGFGAGSSSQSRSSQAQAAAPLLPLDPLDPLDDLLAPLPDFGGEAAALEPAGHAEAGEDLMDLVQWLHEDEGTLWLNEAAGGPQQHPAAEQPRLPGQLLPAAELGASRSVVCWPGPQQHPAAADAGPAAQPAGPLGAMAPPAASHAHLADLPQGPFYWQSQQAQHGVSLTLATAGSSSLPLDAVLPPVCGLQPQLPAQAHEHPAAARQAAHPQLSAQVQMSSRGLDLIGPHWVETQVTRVSVKLFDVTPEQLAPHVRDGLLQLVASDPSFLSTAVRPGCTHVTMSGMVRPAEVEALARQGAKGIAQRALALGAQWVAEGKDDGRWAANMMVQVGSQVAVVSRGQLVSNVDISAQAPKLLLAHPPALLVAAPPPGTAAAAAASSAALASALAERAPLATAGSVSSACSADDTAWESGSERSHDSLSAAAAAATAASASAWPPLSEAGVVTLIGQDICGSHDMVVCRQAGRVLDLEVLSQGKLPPSAPRPAGVVGPLEWVAVRPLRPGVGLLEFEVQRGAVLSRALPVLGLPSHRAVHEVHLMQRTLAGVPGYTRFLQSLGLSLQPAGSPAQLAAQLQRTARAHGWEELSALLELAHGRCSHSPAFPPVCEAAEEAAAEEEAEGERQAAGSSSSSSSSAAVPPVESSSCSSAAGKGTCGAPEPVEPAKPCPAAAAAPATAAKLAAAGAQGECKGEGSGAWAGKAAPAPALPADEAGALLPKDLLYEGVMGTPADSCARAGARPRSLGLELCAAAFVGLAAAALAVRAAAGGF